MSDEGIKKPIVVDMDDYSYLCEAARAYEREHHLPPRSYTVPWASLWAYRQAV